MLDIEILSRQLEREKIARKAAEHIAETKSRVLYQANIELANKEKRTNAILEATADGIFVLNKNQEIETCNRKACELFGYEGQELKGKNISTLLNQNSYESLKHALSIESYSDKNDIFYEIEGVCKDTKIILLELAISRMPLTDDSLIIFAVRNITNRKEEERRLLTQHELTRIMAENSSLDEAAYKILGIMCKTMHLDESAMWRVDQNNNVLRCSVTWSIEDKRIQDFAKISKKITLSLGEGLPGRVWKNKQSCWIKNINTDMNFPRVKYAQKAALISAFAMPILFEGDVVGVFEFFTREIYPFNESFLSMLNDISNQMGVCIDREQAQKRISSLSRFAGMAEVASNVLHNVGNSLNSINISAEMIADKVTFSKMDNLNPLMDLLQQHQHELGAFLSDPAKGKNILPFLSRLAEEWAYEKKYLLNEIHLLMNNIEHVKKIISTQQSLSHASGLTEKITIDEVLEDSLLLNKMIFEQSAIKIIKNFMPIKKVIIDRVKLFQIIDNLIKNAIDALIESHIETKELTLILREVDALMFMIQVIDNGIGMPPENTTMIFSQGYTTKKTGHGFGLHASALYANELGGKIFAETKGLGFGATFTLILPYKPISKGDKNGHSKTNTTG